MHSVSYFAPLENNNVATSDVFLQVNCAGHAIYPYQPIGNSVRHDYYLIYLIRGEFSIHKPAVDRHLLPGDLIVYEAEQPFHYSGVSESVDYYWVHFTGADAEKLLHQCGIALNTPIEIGLSDTVTEAFSAIFLSFMQKESMQQLRLAANLLSLFIALSNILKKSPSTESASSLLVARSTAYIHEHIQEELTVEDLARREFLSTGRYREIFRLVLGVSPGEYMLRLRTHIACDLLRSTQLPIAEVARQIGYPDSRYFSRIFRKRTGLTPSAYRKRI